MLERLQHSRRKYTQIDKLATGLRVSTEALDAAIDILVTEGDVVRNRKDRVALASRLGLITGRLQVSRRGRAVVLPDLREAPIAVSSARVRPAMHGDRVLVDVSLDRRGSRGLRSGTIVRVLERAMDTLVGTFAKQGGPHLVPDDPRIGYAVEVRDADPSLRVGEKVVGHILRYPDRKRGIEVAIAETLGREGLFATEIRAVCASMGIPDSFSPEVEEQARAFAEPGPRELRGRRDLRSELTFTIDGADARDFDDAVSIRERGSQGWTLTVSIADVAHYVEPGTELDVAAYERATSVYFPGRAVPMLPEALSNGLASLKPDVDRLAVSVALDIDRRGRVRGCDFARSVIRSDARLTYEQVESILEGRGRRDTRAPLTAALESMAACTRALANRRSQRGALDLDVDESEVLIADDGRPADIRRRERLFAHRLIEEFMIAANEAVARRLEKANVGFLYRIHQRPDEEALDRLVPRLRALGVALERDGHELEPSGLQRVLSSPAAARSLRQVNLLVLRSLMQARYSPYKEIHFGLASQAYCHFTSPIRRYPDLVVHRALTNVVDGHDRALPNAGALEPVAEHCSRMERRAVDAERDIVRLAAVLYMQDHIGSSFSGAISSVERFGYFVQLDEPFVEGFVPLARLDEYYDYVAERMTLESRTSGHTIAIGNRVKVRVQAAELPGRKIDFIPLEYV